MSSFSDMSGMDEDKQKDEMPKSCIALKIHGWFGG